MTQGRCAKCGGKDLRTKTKNIGGVAIQVTALRGAYLRHVICVDCGFVESYVADPKQLKKIAEKWTEKT